MKICKFEMAFDRDRLEDSSAQATGFVSTIMLKSDDGVAVSNLLANSHDKVLLGLTFCLWLLAVGSIDAIHTLRWKCKFHVAEDTRRYHAREIAYKMVVVRRRWSFQTPSTTHCHSGKYLRRCTLSKYRPHLFLSVQQLFFTSKTGCLL